MIVAAPARPPYPFAARTFEQDISTLIRHAECHGEMLAYRPLVFRTPVALGVTQISAVIERGFLTNSDSISILRILKIAQSDR